MILLHKHSKIWHLLLQATVYAQIFQVFSSTELDLKMFIHFSWSMLVVSLPTFYFENVFLCFPNEMFLSIGKPGYFGLKASYGIFWEPEVISMFVLQSEIIVGFNSFHQKLSLLILLILSLRYLYHDTVGSWLYFAQTSFWLGTYSLKTVQV